jgi:hypothetical protein
MTPCRLLSVLAVLCLAPLAPGAPEEQPADPQPPEAVHSPAGGIETTTPEPNAALLAGLGGLALLFFALRRK